MKILPALLLMASLTAHAGVKEDFLNGHNNWRIKLNSGQIVDQPIPSPSIPLMEWDEDLASDAQEYADKCVFKHADDRNGAGENLALGASPSWSVDLWAEEHADYTYPGGFSSSTGHYTQIIWDTTTKLGCGFATSCRMAVCRYRTHGNIHGLPPYEQLKPGDSPVYKNDFIVDNILYNNKYYQIKMSEFVLYSFKEISYNSNKTTNHISYIDGHYILYIPFVKVGDTEYYALLEYNIDTREFILTDFGIVLK